MNTFLQENKIDGLILPSSDEYFSEYVNKDSNRILKITGFSGSNGIAILTDLGGVLLTDSRYTEQAKYELPDNFEIVDLAKKRLSECINTLHLTNIGFLAELHTIFEIEKLREDVVATLMPISCVKLDTLLGMNNTHTHPISDMIYISADKTGVDTHSVIEKMDIKDAILICDPASVCYLLNIRGKSIEHCGIFNCFAAIFKDGSHQVLHNLYDIDYMVRIFKDSVLVEADFSQLSFHIYQALSSKLKNRKNPIIALKATKNPQEIEGMRAANIADSIAVNKFIAWIKKHHALKQTEELTEIDAISRLLRFRKENPSFIEESFATIMGSGPNSAIIHYCASPKTNRAIKDNDVLLIDSGGHYDYYGTSDITRTLYIGNIVPQEIKKNYTLVLKGHIALARAIFPRGTCGAQLDILARQYLWQDNKDYGHGTGHGVGYYLSVHEGPCAISRGSYVPIQAGMIMSNEPGFYIPGKYGIRIENLMLTKQHPIFSDMLCFETITFVELEHSCIDHNMLSQEEQVWIDEYEQMITNISVD